ncbi:MAG: tetratricopeptide repeat protein [Planctomycetota bacterium]|jgi:predicted O-linked N-acetylglucosamine transferase (SPINDLY family)
MPTVPETLQLAKQHHQAGNLQTAERLYVQVLEAQPGHPEALYLLGLLSRQRGRPEVAVQYLCRAAEANPNNPVFFYAWGNALADAGDAQAAIAKYRRAIKLHPDFVDAHNNLGLTLAAAGKTAEAIRCYRAALKLEPDHVEALVNLGNALRRERRLDEASDCYRRAVRAQPNAAVAQNNLGNVLLQQGRVEESIAHLLEAAGQAPDYAEAHNNLANAYRARGDLARALECVRRAVKLAPREALIHLNLGSVLLEASQAEEAIDAYRRALELDPRSGQARWHCHLALPVIYETADEIPAWRKRFEEGLGTLVDETPLETGPERATALEGVGSFTPFLLAYQGRDDLALQRTYGELAHRVMAASYPKWTRHRRMPALSKDGRIRVGYVSTYFRFHSGARWAIGLLEERDRRRFEVRCYSAGLQTDHVTERFKSACDSWFHRPGDLEALARRIVKDRLHVLFFTDIGMDPLSTQLAALRLAAVQCTAWGHPVTSGLPTVDYYLSSDLMEPPGAEAHYTERLVRLPNLGFPYPRPSFPDPPKSRDALGLPADDLLYLSCQSLFKYLPQHDHLYAEIVRQVPEARLVFIEGRNELVTGKFRARMHGAFDEAGLDADRSCIFVPRLDPETDFRSLLLDCDVFLDTPGWSGGNTALEGLAAGLPVVTMPGPLMRGRHAYAMLKMIDLPETIAADEAEFVTLAVRLGRDAAWRSEMVERVSAGRDRLFGDPAPLRAFEALCERLVAEGAGEG